MSTYVPPGAYADTDHIDAEVPEKDVAGRVRRPPAPGQESAGPPLGPLVSELAASVRDMNRLYHSAMIAARDQTEIFQAQAQMDSNGDGLIRVFSVPAGFNAKVMIVALDDPLATPANPVTSANLWHALYAAKDGVPTQAQLVAGGQLLDCAPTVPTIDTQVPYVYRYGSRDAAPTVRGDETIWMAIDAYTANRVLYVRGAVILEGREH